MIEPAPLRIVIASASDRIGGAGIAASRLRDGLIGQGCSVRLVIQTQTCVHPDNVAPSTALERSISRLRSTIDSYPVRRYNVSPAVFSASWLPRFWPSLADAGDSDLVHLHWTNAGFMSVSDVAAIDRPVVWTLHDMWAFTGGCQYDSGCERFTVGCGSCPVLASNKTVDLSSRRFALKRRSWRDLRLTAVAPSRWMAQQASRSKIFENKRIEVIRNGIDLGVFKPISREVACAAFNLPSHKNLVLFGALNSGSDIRKGFDLLTAAMGRVTDGLDAAALPVLVVFGADPPRREVMNGMQVHHVGHLHDDVALALLYSACNVFVAPSRQDNLPNTVAEALACGLPCVAFNVGGLSDLVSHCETGYLAAPLDTNDLAAGILWCLDPIDGRSAQLRFAARQFAHQELDAARQAERHIELYTTLVGMIPEKK